MDNNIVMILAVATLILAFLLGQYVICDHLVRKARIILKDVSKQEVKPRSGIFIIKFKVENPNRFKILLRNIEYVFYANDYLIGNGTIQCEQNIPSGNSVEFEAKLQVENSSTVGQIWAALKWRAPISWRVKGNAIFGSLLGTIAIPFNITI